MNREGLEISDIEAILQPDVRLSRCQLANIFGVYYGTITANIKAVIRSGTVKPSFEGTLVHVGKTVLPERCNMEMVIALAFRLDSPAAEQVRRFVMQRMVAGIGKPAVPIFLSYGTGAVLN